MMIARRSGFTLIELSIVLVIVGLIVGGILVGRDLIRAAELRSIITQRDQFIAASFTFKTKYNCMPGDCPTATSFFGAKALCPTGFDPGSLPPLTCNGNGDGIIGDSSDITLDRAERIRFWQHLVAAELIPGDYGNLSGHNDIPGTISTGTNGWYPVPNSRFPGGCFYASNEAIGGDVYPGYYGNMLTFGYAENLGCRLPLLSNLEAHQVDMKADDGKPGTGSVRSRTPFFFTPLCGTSTDPAVSVYNDTDPSVACALVFPNVF